MIIETKPHSNEEMNDYIKSLIKEETMSTIRCVDCGIVWPESEMKKTFHRYNSGLLSGEGLCKKCWYFEDLGDK